jgi:hypothetical protein
VPLLSSPKGLMGRETSGTPTWVGAAYVRRIASIHASTQIKNPSPKPIPRPPHTRRALLVSAVSLLTSPGSISASKSPILMPLKVASQGQSRMKSTPKSDVISTVIALMPRLCPGEQRASGDHPEPPEVLEHKLPESIHWETVRTTNAAERLRPQGRWHHRPQPATAPPIWQSMTCTF